MHYKYFLSKESNLHYINILQLAENNTCTTQILQLARNKTCIPQIFYSEQRIKHALHKYLKRIKHALQDYLSVSKE